MLIIFTDLDGTLLNQEDYDYKPAIPVIEELKKKNIPLIPVTSKTRAEVQDLRETLGLNDPFIVENGSGIFIPENDDRFNISDTEKIPDYHLKINGCNYTEARAGLKVIQSTVRITNLKGFGDLSIEDVQSHTGLNKQEAKQAKTREFSEPFLTPKNTLSQDMEKTAAEFGFRVLVGDRFSHLIGANAGKGKAVQWLLNNYLSSEKITTIGLGNSPNDLEMLEVVNIPIVIASKKGIHPGLANRGWQTPKSPGSKGWAEVVTKEIADKI